jgi:tRNA pseudouridine38-40 synthase
MRWKCTVAYDGTDFEGWQAQPGGNTIQDHIERRLAQLFKGPVRIHGSGRTDSGVHARSQVFHFDGDWPHGVEALLMALRTGYPDCIQVSHAEPVDDAFHARYSASGKHYSYTWYEGWAPPFLTRTVNSLGNRRLDCTAMRAAAAVLIGRHDFSAFSANPRDDREDNPVKDLRRLDISSDGKLVRLDAVADGFLYRMVRSLAGCLEDVGCGKLDAAAVAAILASKVRTNRVQTAPARGLCLEEVYYDGGINIGHPPIQ